MQPFFQEVKDKQLLAEAEDRLLAFEKEAGLHLPKDYRSFLRRLEAYIGRMRKKIPDEEALSEHIDDLFCDYYFTIPEMPGEFNITDLANISLGYALLDEMQNENPHPGYLLIGDVWHSADLHYFLALKLKENAQAEVYLLPDSKTNEELQLGKIKKTDPIFVSDSFVRFMADLG